MEKNEIELSEASEKLGTENKQLQQQLLEALELIATLKAGDVDAIIVGHKNDLKVYSEKTSDQTYRILIEKMHEGAVTINKAGIILFCNSYFATMVNMPLQKVIGSRFETFIGDSFKVEFNTQLRQGWVTNSQNEISLVTADGRTTPVLISANALTLDDNFVLSLILTDLTVQYKNREELQLRKNELELKNLELENANSDLTTFTYVSSHDLQEPLRKIQTFISIILRDTETDLSAASKTHFERVREAAKRMQALIEDLLIYSRTKSDERKFEKTDLKMIVADVAIDFEDLIKEKNATLDTTKLGEASVIPFQFRQVIYNLIGNSLKFARQQTALDIIIESEIIPWNKSELAERALPLLHVDYSHITFTDTGIGFDPKFNERIFEVFQRLHSREEYKGTGMGLSICKRIIENHRGIITASGELDKGARFDIYIPAVQDS